MEARQAQIFMDAHELNLTFQSNKPDSEGSWRVDPELYRKDDGLVITPGLATLGFLHCQGQEQPGKKVRIASDIGSSDHPSLAQAGARRWLQDNVKLAALMSVSVAIVNPEQYALSRETLVRLARKEVALRPACRTWPFAFTSLAAVGNRTTIIHRDRKSGKNNLYDVMTTIGGDPNVKIRLKGLGFTGDYKSGSIAVLSCHTHLHSVSKSPSAERLAFAAYMKPSVLLEMGLDLPRLPTYDSIRRLHVQQIATRHTT
ncbi:unnamed protein product [Peniophora sp. CBMAI 1063]|nr:unnamed protein product [Peniophora sp. CBMAI 1063]